MFYGKVFSQNPALVLYNQNWYERNGIESVFCTTQTISANDTIESFGPNFHYNRKKELLTKVHIDSNGQPLKKLNQYYRINDCNLPIQVNNKRTDTLSVIINCVIKADTLYEQAGIYHKTNSNCQLLEKWTDTTNVNYFFESYEYDSNGKLSRISHRSNKGSFVSEYRYDRSGRLVKIDSHSMLENLKQTTETQFIYNEKSVELKTIMNKNSL